MEEKVLEKLDSGELVATKSALAFDEDIFCKQCGSTFTLAEGNWEGTHPDFPGGKAVGLKCPSCQRVNVAYYKTNTLIKLEKRLRRLGPGKAKAQAQRKYENEFLKVQRKYWTNVQTVQEKES